MKPDPGYPPESGFVIRLLLVRKFFILFPTFDFEVVDAQRTKGLDKCTGQPRIRDQRYIQVDGCPPDLVSVVEFSGCQVFGNIHHHVDLLALQ